MLGQRTCIHDKLLGVKVTVVAKIVSLKSLAKDFPT
jgi:hypothetical protein